MNSIKWQTRTEISTRRGVPQIRSIIRTAAATMIVALCASTASAVELETKLQANPLRPAGAKDSSANSKSKVQWQPVRIGQSAPSHPVRTVRYEEDVFDDGPALGRKATLAAAPLSLGQAKEPLRSPFETEPPPPPMPEPGQQTPPPFAPTPMPPSELPPPQTEQPPPSRPEFREPTTREPSLVPEPSPPPARTPDFSPPPESLQPFQPSPLPGYEFPQRERIPRNPAEDCETAYNKLKQNTIDKLSIDISVPGQPGADMPFECTLGDDLFDPRCWKLTTYTWKASALCHKPIYFEDVALERYGHSHGPVCEYFASAAHFFGDVALLPYHMGIKTPCECEYTLGYYRPGSCAPYILDPFPVSLRGAAFGAVGYCGVVALFP
jgi:hypothetical protein